MLCDTGNMEMLTFENTDPNFPLASGAKATECRTKFGQPANLLRVTDYKREFSTIPEDEGTGGGEMTTHVTINGGKHENKEMRRVAEAMFQGHPSVKLPPKRRTPGGQMVEYSFEKARIERAEIEVLATYGIPTL